MARRRASYAGATTRHTMATTKDILRSCSIIAFALSFGACTATGEVDDNAAEIMNNASNVVDMSTTPDLGDAPNTTPTMADMGSMTTPSPEDMGSEPGPDMGSDMGMVEQDMAPSVDMTPETWPEHSGTACDVDGAGGVCLPTSRCAGQSVSGRCPGPADMQCCLLACEPGDGDPGLCTAPSACMDWAPSQTCVGPQGSSGCCRLDPGKGRSIGQLWNTFYYLSQESEHPGPANTALNDSNCNTIATVSADFSDSVCIEGSGKLADGRVINYAETCSCGRPCPTGGIICYSVLDSNQFPWGKGARSNPLEPLRSLAVDRNRISLGTVVYLEQWDGFTVPSAGGLGGFVHDGCFRADDVGGAIQGDHIDIFAGNTEMWQALEGSFPTNTRFDAYVDTPGCAYLKQ